MQCELCNQNPAITTVDEVLLCNSCYEHTKGNFAISCDKCKRFIFTEKNEYNTAGLAQLIMAYEGANINEISLNLMVICMQESDLTMIGVDKCKHCAKEVANGKDISTVVQ